MITTTFEVSCFCTDASKIIKMWEEAADYLDAEISYKTFGIVTKTICFKLSFENCKMAQFKSLFNRFKKMYDGAHCL